VVGSFAAAFVARRACLGFAGIRLG